MKSHDVAVKTSKVSKCHYFCKDGWVSFPNSRSSKCLRVPLNILVLLKYHLSIAQTVVIALKGLLHSKAVLLHCLYKLCSKGMLSWHAALSVPYLQPLILRMAHLVLCMSEKGGNHLQASGVAVVTLCWM